MQIAGSRRISASPANVWAVIDDPEMLRACLPGCEGLDRVTATHMIASGSVHVGGFRDRFTSRVALSDIDPPHGLSLVYDGSCGASGFTKGVAALRLTPEGTRTRVDYTWRAEFDGRIAGLGDRALEDAAQKAAEDFLDALSARCASSFEGPLPLTDAPPLAYGLDPIAPTVVSSTPDPVETGITLWRWRNIAMFAVFLAMVFVLVIMNG
ncbi:hypothetical protein GCM10007276_07880 [Agaricicola taiwanensis]|uniref:Carbon monoxide dehydrogenase n=1 Tax=Agaricicola taiwanensis TaxID=591372 RepID=A0A8J2VPH1_9RHOB|nr:carbon monoxide dehydrogenase subunit G [Agaricicola taiwanensis]GGE33043.1 hypothetical protein GCM10007276_07880 [Agaricicola taiwanensis]